MIPNLREQIENKIHQKGFKPYSCAFRHPDVEELFVWRKRNLNINRGVALIFSKEQIDPGPFASLIKKDLGKSIGYVPFFYGLGLQIILAGPKVQLPLPQHLETYVDAVDTQTTVLQSIFAVNTESLKHVEGRTWGQVISKKFQDAISEGIREWKQLY